MSEIELHRKLLGDAPRNAAFHAALKQLIEPGKTTVADIGAGTGFLSFLARRLGAAHCTLIEYSGMIELAQKLARQNGIDQLTFVRGHSAELRKPPKVDLVVSETLGNFALEEGLLETLIDARRYLKAGGRVLPQGLRQFAAPVTAARLQQEIDIWPQVGFDLDLSAARTVSLNNMYVKQIAPADLGGRDCGQAWDELDLRPQAKAADSRRTATLRWKAGDLPAARVEGIALWWVCELLPGIELSTSPFAPATHWDQIYLPLLAPLELAPDDVLELSLSCDTRPDVGVRLGWKTRQLRGGKAVGEQVQDSFKGRVDL
ncbi:methyltransferase domain-containing protein [Solimonas sp. K1W22B-7]|uniref:methyltransferase domain-containing protein n=1 Tax=Solimonas sp. K1W22B-7 TaxID=2303331 RepID=UPI0013C46743|nr:class I SAM-dependent methyltransferase [Solimonas sp. K1W22B-7]